MRAALAAAAGSCERATRRAGSESACRTCCESAWLSATRPDARAAPPVASVALRCHRSSASSRYGAIATYPCSHRSHSVSMLSASSSASPAPRLLRFLASGAAAAEAGVRDTSSSRSERSERSARRAASAASDSAAATSGRAREHAARARRSGSLFASPNAFWSMMRVSSACSHSCCCAATAAPLAASLFDFSFSCDSSSPSSARSSAYSRSTSSISSSSSLSPPSSSLGPASSSSSSSSPSSPSLSSSSSSSSSPARRRFGCPSTPASASHCARVVFRPTYSPPASAMSPRSRSPSRALRDGWRLSSASAASSASSSASRAAPPHKSSSGSSSPRGVGSANSASCSASDLRPIARAPALPPFFNERRAT
mmetsp:Transcript_22266/g.72169  ORF Transcript_22266/g.72169 Transcript_22266/m.72169 type:complete len:370 (-) Transcript_22266:132-1241(-)